MSDSKFNWGSAIIGAIFSLIVAVAGGLILINMQAKNPNLVYSSTGTIPFEGQDEIIGIYYVIISNSGKKEAKAVNCYIGLETASIKEWKISIDPAIQYSNSSDSKSISLDVPTLNPSEEIKVYILASTTTTLPEKVSVSLRGEGIIGSEGTASERSSLFDNPEIQLIFIVGILVVIIQIMEVMVKLFDRSRSWKRILREDSS